MDVWTAIARARAALGAGRPDEALNILAQLPGETAGAAEPLQLQAQALLDQGSPRAAVEAFRRAVQAAPGDGRAELGLAMALGESGQSSEAAEAAQRAIAKGEDNASAHYVLGRALLDSQRHQEAEARWRHLLQRHPGHAATHESLSELIWMSSGNIQQASQALEQALRQAPGRSDLRILLARLFDTAGHGDTAMRLVEAGVSLAPDHVGLRLAASRHALAVDPAQALAHASAALRVAPGNPMVVAAYGDALLGNGLAQQAAVVAERLHAFNPNDSHALALRATAWRMLGDPRHPQLVDYGRLVQASMIEAPPGWTDLPSYLADLTASLGQKHRWRAHPVDQTLRLGSQVALHPEHADDPAVAAFPQAVHPSIRQYLERLGKGEDATSRRNTGNYRYSGMWSVQLRAQGRHLNHFHGQGWISSASYIALPPTLGNSGGEGWLTFGEPAVASSPAWPPEYLIRPEPGLLVLFPSWMWHGTVPFSGGPGQTRLTVAFDLLPA